MKSYTLWTCNGLFFVARRRGINAPYEVLVRRVEFVGNLRSAPYKTNTSFLFDDNTLGHHWYREWFG